MSPRPPEPMTDEQLAQALRVLKPIGELPKMALFRADVLEMAGLDLAHVERWATAHGGGTIEAGQLKLRKGQRPEQGRPGKPQPFYAVPLELIR